MTRLFSILKGKRFLALIAAFVCLGVLSGVLVWARNARRIQKVQPSVTSATSAIRVVESEMVTLGALSILYIKLQNVSKKDIDGYIVRNGSAWITRNYYLSDERFAPGQTVDLQLPISDNLPEAKGTFGDPQRQTLVSAVVFSDGMTDGESRSVKMLSDERAGSRDQADRVLPELRACLLAGVSEGRAFQDLETRVAALPEKEPERLAVDYDNGLANVKRLLEKRIKDIKEQSQSSRRADAAKTQQGLTRVLERLAQSP